MHKVIHVITTISRGGAENQLVTLVSEQVKSGREVTVIYLKGDPELSLIIRSTGAKVLDILAKKNFIRQIITLRKFLKGNECIVHAHLPKAELLSAICVRKNFLVLSKHNSEQFFPKAPRFVSFLLARYVYRKSQQCIFISKAVLIFLLNNREVYTNKKNKIIYYGVSPKKYENRLNKHLEKKVTIGTIARIVDQKDYATLIKAFKIYRDYNKHAKLLIIGDGNKKNEMVQLTKDLKISSNVDWMGRTNKISDVLKQMDVFVLASKYEGFGLVLLEAMQESVPIIASRTSAIPEVTGKSYPGLFQPGDVDDLVRRLKKAQTFEFQKLLVSRYKKRLVKFSASKMRSNMDSAYSDATKVAR
jgi:glycosyltransferase involved in cell wall biosynthesis